MKPSFKPLSAACLLALAPALSLANIIPTLDTVVPNGAAFTWTYDLQLSSDQTVFSGPAPASNPVNQSRSDAGAFLTLYDFFGFVPGSCISPAGWTCTAQNVGFRPADVSATDDAGIVNITWTYTSGPDISGQPNGIDLGAFLIDSIYSQTDLVSYTARAIKNNGASIDTFADNVGQTAGPINPALTIPEPGSMALMLLGIGLVGLLGRQRKACT
jgi:PEP-CTERM motif